MKTRERWSGFILLFQQIVSGLARGAFDPRYLPSGLRDNSTSSASSVIPAM